MIDHRTSPASRRVPTAIVLRERTVHCLRAAWASGYPVAPSQLGGLGIDWMWQGPRAGEPVVALRGGLGGSRRVDVTRRGHTVTERHEHDGVVVHIDKWKCDSVDDASLVAAYRVRQLMRGT